MGPFGAASLFVGLGAGFVMHRSDFCLVCPFRDIFLFRNDHMLRVYALLAVASAVLFETARVCGLLPSYPFPLLGNPSLANVAGGALFGFGMVLSGGCVVGTLYKMGAGALAGAVTFAGLLAGSVLYAEIHPWWAPFAASTTFLSGRATIPQWAGISPAWFAWGAAAAAVPLFAKWAREGKWVRRAGAAGYLQPWAAALCLAVLGAVSWAAVGMPMGVTTTYAKLGGWLESLFAKERVEALAYFRIAAPLARDPATGLFLSGGPGPVFDALAAIQAPLIAGIAAGSALSAVSLGEWRLSPMPRGRQAALAFGGGVAMGLASRMAAGCNVWHLLGGIPIFALPSALFLAGLLPGAWLGSRIIEKAFT